MLTTIQICAIIFIIIIVIAIIYYFTIYKKKESEKTTQNDSVSELENYFKPGIDHDTIYYQVTDQFDVKGFVHDSGIKPSILRPDSNLSSESFSSSPLRDEITIELRISKIEYNEGESKNI